MKSALFVDFDNVFSGLRRLDPAAADRFALRPLDWIQWLTQALPAPPHAPEVAARRLLVRRCYLNPQVYQRFRPAFNRAGFEIIDCPAMTSEGKTSTDIHMVLDIVDLLQHQVHYDEFIVFSADADFTPVLRKLRRWDRRTTVLAIGFPSAAYQASADLLIDQDEFVRAGLGFEEPEPATPPSMPSRAKSDVARDVASFIARTVAASGKPVPLPWIASKLPAEVKGLDAADWAGFTNFRTLVDSLKLEPLVVKWDTGVVLDPVRHVGTERSAGPSSGGAPAVNGLAAISQLIRDEVRTAGRPVPCGRLAQIIIDRQGAIAADWGGKGTFRRLLESLDLAPLRIDWSTAGGVVTDPAFPMEGPGSEGQPKAADWGRDQDLWPVINLVHAATGLPILSPGELAAVLASLAQDLAEHPFQLSETGKRVRDRCRDGGHAVSRGDVSFVLKGIQLGGHVFGAGADDPQALAQRFVGSVLELCRREQLALDDGQSAQLRDWATRGASAS
ncbi:MAG: NYN domain-containing protein [Rubrivivax sp.]|nr:NYN domain-containing protein [Rubrivivax sp.]